MGTEYTVDKMLTNLEEHFNSLGYECDRYLERLNPARVPLYCLKRKNGKISDEVVVEVTTLAKISREDFFPKLIIRNVTIVRAASLVFLKYYLPYAKVFLAYPDYVKEDEILKQLRMTCKECGIGLLRVSKSAVEEDVEAKPQALFDQLCKDMSEAVDFRSFLKNHVENCLHYLVYYPDPIYRRREIIGRTDGNLSWVLINKLCELEHIKQKETLREFATEYRGDTREDYDIALAVIKKLWNDCIGTDYPEIQREFEPILLLNSRYRDHFLHQFQVYLLGAILIDALYSDDAFRKLKERLGINVEDAWLAAATFHDFNYNIQAYEEWTMEFLRKTLNLSQTNPNPSFLNLEGSFVRDSFLNATYRLCEMLGCDPHDPVVVRFFYEKTVDERNHAFLSAFTLMKFLSSSSCKLDKKSVDQAALAILLHDEDNWKFFCGGRSDCEWKNSFSNKKLLEQLSFSESPLLFLLIYCDTAQEWGRVGRDYLESEPRLETFSISEAESIVHISVKNDTFYDKKRGEIERVKKFLSDKRFKIRIESRDGGQVTDISMTGS